MSEQRPIAGVAIRFEPAAEEALGVMAKALGVSWPEVIRRLLELGWWLFRERQAGSKFLVQRGGEVTEMMLPNLDPVRQPAGDDSGPAA